VSARALQALEGIPAERADWILWVDMDLLVANMNFTFPIDKYAGKDMILHGDMEYIKKGDARRGAPVAARWGCCPLPGGSW
jgi:hypothetical protein